MTLGLAHCRTLECPVVEEQVPGPFYDFLRFVFGDDVISGVSWSYGQSQTNVIPKHTQGRTENPCSAKDSVA